MSRRHPDPADRPATPLTSGTTPTSAPPGDGLALLDIRVSFGGRVVLPGVTLRVARGEVVALLGASGSGKSTLLAVAAGLRRPDAGRVFLGGVDVTDVPAHRRGVGLLFQDPMLFPHLDVAGNVGYAPVVAARPAADRDAEVRRWLTLVGLPGYERRRVATLSGGEAQRVALARTLAGRPRAVCLDEPFAALDRPLRDRLAPQVAALLRDLGAPVVHVTHDPAEAAAVGDRVVRLADLAGAAADGAGAV